MSVFSNLDKLVKNNGSTNSEAKRKEQIKRNIKEAAGMKSPAPQVKSTEPSYVYKDAKKTNDLDLDRIRTFIKTEINAEPNGDPDQVWYNVDYGTNQKEGRFYALKCHLGTKKQKTIKKAYNVDELVTYFFGPISEDDFNGYSQYPETWANRSMIWNQYYNGFTWLSHVRGGAKQVVKQTQTEIDKRYEAAKKCSSKDAYAAHVRSTFEDLSVGSVQDKNNSVANKKKTENSESKLKKYKKILLKAIANQITHDCLYSDVYKNGVEDTLNSINNKYLPEEIKNEIMFIDNIEDEIDSMITATAKAIGQKIPVYEAGQDDGTGDTNEVWISTNKDAVQNRVKDAVESICEINKDEEQIKILGYSTFEEYKQAEMDKVYCYRIY